MTVSEATPCQICQGATHLCGAVDFHKSCLEEHGRALNPSGLSVQYRQCQECGFVFCDTFKAWTPEQFKAAIYNQDYALVDPDYSESRPASSAAAVDHAFSTAKGTFSILDYGGGNGRFAEIMRNKGYHAETYDPFSDHHQRPTEKADMVTAFEVMEHTNTPQKTLRDMASLLKDEGLILFTTRLQPANFAALGLNWWYVAPRNGHVSIYSETALKRLCRDQGLHLRSLNDDAHIAYRQLPLFARHLGFA